MNLAEKEAVLVFNRALARVSPSGLQINSYQDLVTSGKAAYYITTALQPHFDDGNVVRDPVSQVHFVLSELGSVLNMDLSYISAQGIFDGNIRDLLYIANLLSVVDPSIFIIASDDELKAERRDEQTLRNYLASSHSGLDSDSQSNSPSITSSEPSSANFPDSLSDVVSNDNSKASTPQFEALPASEELDIESMSNESSSYGTSSADQSSSQGTSSYGSSELDEKDDEKAWMRFIEPELVAEYHRRAQAVEKKAANNGKPKPKKKKKKKAKSTTSKPFLAQNQNIKPVNARAKPTKLSKQMQSYALTEIKTGAPPKKQKKQKKTAHKKKRRGGPKFINPSKAKAAREEKVLDAQDEIDELLKLAARIVKATKEYNKQASSKQQAMQGSGARNRPLGQFDAGLLPSTILDIAKQLRAEESRAHKTVFKKVKVLAMRKHVSSPIKRKVKMQIAAEEKAIAASHQWSDEAASNEAYKRLLRLEHANSNDLRRMLKLETEKLNHLAKQKEEQMRSYLRDQVDMFNEEKAKIDQEKELRRQGKLHLLRNLKREANEEVLKALKDGHERIGSMSRKYHNDLMDRVEAADPLHIGGRR